jgi:hypothetical protein
MILGIHIYLFTDRWSDDRLEVLDTAASLGAGAVEIAVGDDVHFTPRLTRRRAEQLGLRTYVGPGGLWPLECDLSSDDPAERAAYARVFGDRLAALPISTVKGALGHCLCGAGGIEAAVTTLALARGVLPPTAGFAETDDGPRLDVVAGTGRPCPVDVALSCSFAFGGNSAAVVLGRVA